MTSEILATIAAAAAVATHRCAGWQTFASARWSTMQKQ
jgi:hypothetical protein